MLAATSPTKIGDHALNPASLMMGYGFDPALSEGSLKPPIFLTSTFVFETAADGKRFFEGITGKSDGSGRAEGLVYSRFNGPNQEILEDRLGIWEEAEDALAFARTTGPVMGLLRDLVVRRDPRPVRLAYAVGQPANLACLDEIAAGVAHRDGHHQDDLEDRANEDHEKLLHLADAGPEDEQRHEG